MDVVLEYRTVPEIINDSLLKRTMKAVNSRFGMCESARWTMVFKQVRYILKSSHKLGSNMMVFLGILDSSNGEGGLSINGR